jgi:hypothetical protein
MRILERLDSEQGIPPLKESSEVSRAQVMKSAFEKTDHVISTVVGSVHKKLPPIPGSIAEIIADDTESGYESAQKSVSIPSLVTTEEKTDGSSTITYRENKYTKKGIVSTETVSSLQKQDIDIFDVMVKQTELSTPQITTMLNKLLHEWSIFGGSGLFGMGPGGAEHPLFKQLSVLSMGEVVAGRWNNADPKVIKIIKQYVDAWRHEQGIIFTPNETFEHYLRRVVQRIVKRQSI